VAVSARISELLDKYDGFLIDAYGVLNDAGGALPGAADFLEELRRRKKAWTVLTNDASRTPTTIATRLRGFGLAVDAEQVICAGSLLTPHFAAQRLHGKRTICLGTADSRQMVEDAGGRVVEPGDRSAPVEVIVAADDAGYDFLPAIEETITAAIRAIDAGTDLHLVLPNPDYFYPKPRGELGITSGAVALLIQSAIDRLRPSYGKRFVELGKPHRAIYDEACRRIGTRNALAIGDQLDTDIAGAVGAGLDAALVDGGVGRWHPGVTPEPTWLLSSITP
jgi:HAD superfamily hydrolase (TIGR01450 family)